MAEIKKREHCMSLNERRQGTFTGVEDVLSFDEKQILLETSRGMLNIKGKELHVSRLQLEEGELDIEGQVDSLVYHEGREMGKKKSDLLKRIFQ